MFKVFEKKKVDKDTFIKLQDGLTQIRLVTCDADGNAIADIVTINKVTGEVVVIMELPIQLEKK